VIVSKIEIRIKNRYAPPLSNRTVLEGYPRPMTPNPAKPEKRIAQRVGYCDSWWSGMDL